ncbi:MAG: calcium-binding protein, partial [Rhodobacteraceae bacterium]|nr:calcium-binding protein [Paracoccaceae bacterium]
MPTTILKGTDDRDRLVANNTTDNFEIFGYDGSDYLAGNENNDSLFGGIGFDTLVGADGNDLLDGGGDGDKLYGGNGDDWLRGGDGRDTIYGDAGADTIDGGDGDDDLLWYGDRYPNGAQDYVLNFRTGSFTGGDAVGDAISGIEAVWLGSGHDTVYGGGVVVSVSLGAGDDLGLS